MRYPKWGARDGLSEGWDSRYRPRVRSPRIPTDEKARLRELARFHVLDTEPEPEFDNLTRLVASQLDVPIALVSLVDETRQWFKSRHGLDAEFTSREVSFCGHVVADDAPLVVTDACADERFADNPLVTGDPRVRFYAGYPLRTQSGHVMGTLCAIDHEARTLDPAQLEVLRILASQAVQLLELRQASAELLAERGALLAAKRAVSAQRARLTTILDGLSDGIVEQNEAGEVTFCNPAALAIFGVEPAELQGSCEWLSGWRWRAQDGSALTPRQHPTARTLATRKGIRAVHRFQRNDAEIWVSLSTAPLFDQDGELSGVVTSVRDITERRAREEELAKARELRTRRDRLATTGTLAAGVGHEINNPLTFVSANLDIALEEVGAIAGGSPSGRLAELGEVLRDAREGAERIRKIVRGLRAFARDDAPVRPTDLASVVDISINMAMHELRPRAAVQVRLSPVPLAVADESRLAQVLVNLLVNSAQAFVHSDPNQNTVTISVAAEGDSHVALFVADNGPGIAPEVLPRIFDPFFTTKATGVGTGLGLSICHNLVGALGGELTCETALGKGTTFKILLPAATDAALASESIVEAPEHPAGRILLIDDEPAILRTMQRGLASDLHEIAPMSDPAAALERIRSGERFDLILCDMMMPELTGAECYKQLCAVAPEMAARVVFITGGITDPATQAFVQSIPNEVLEKPFTMKTLRELARRYIDK